MAGLGPFLEAGSVIFIDGPGFDPNLPTLRAVVWAAVVYDPRGRFL